MVLLRMCQLTKYSTMLASHDPFSYELLHVTMQIRLYHHPLKKDALRFECQSLTPYERIALVVRHYFLIGSLARDCLLREFPRLVEFFNTDYSVKALNC